MPGFLPMSEGRTLGARCQKMSEFQTDDLEDPGELLDAMIT